MQVFMMFGYPATGKTTLAKRLETTLAKQFKVLSVSTLEFRKRLGLFNLDIEDERNKVYKALVEHVKDSIEKYAYDVVIVDGNFNKRYRREMFYNVFKDAAICVVKCIVPDEGVIRQRLDERKRRSDVLENKASTWGLYELIKKETEPVEGDKLVESNIISLVEYDSEKQIVGKLQLNKECRASLGLRAMLDILRQN